MLLYGVLFGCLDPVLTVTCAMAYRYDPGRLELVCDFDLQYQWLNTDEKTWHKIKQTGHLKIGNQAPAQLILCMCRRDPWVLPIEAGARRAATLAKRDLAQGAGGCSDHLALVRAYNGWQAAKRTGGHFKYTSSMFLSNGTMTMIEGMRGQLLGELTVSSLTIQ